MFSTTQIMRAVNRVALCAAVSKTKKLSSDELLAMEKSSSANNYAPQTVFFSKAKGVYAWTPEGKRYVDFLSGYGAVSHGHNHPRLIRVASKQLKQVTLSSRAFHSEMFARYSSFVTKYFGYERVLPMNTGAEGVETALKLARKWAYKVKKVKDGQALIVCATGNFHGRTFGAISMSDDPDSFGNYTPKLKGFVRVRFGCICALEKVFKRHHRRIAAYIVEPIQGEAGIKIPYEGYLKQVRRLCTKYNILFIADEVQSGVGRTGKMLACDHEKVRPDVVILAKALGGGIVPVAAVLADNKFMSVFEPGTHGSTFGGNPLASAIAIEALRVMTEEKLPENSAKMGALLLKRIQAFKERFSFISEVRGRGLFAAIEFHPHVLHGGAAYKFMKFMKNHGVLAKVTHGNIMRLSPPLCITEKQLNEALKGIEAALLDVEHLVKSRVQTHDD